MENRQAGEGLVCIPPLDEPLVHSGGASSGVGGVLRMMSLASLSQEIYPIMACTSSPIG